VTGDVQAKLAALDPDQRAALLARLRRATPRSGIPLAARTDPDIQPVSFEQRRVWFLDQFEPGTAAHNIPVLLEVDGPLDLTALQRALDLLVRRHEALRTTFVTVGGQPRQLIGKPYPVALAHVDLTTEDAGQREAIAAEVTAEEAARGFDLVTGPLWRATVVSLGEARSLLQLTLHHSIADGWSTGVLLTDLTAAYAGRPLQPPAPPLQYADYAAWQQAHFTGPVLEAAIEHWRAELAGTPPLELPADRPRRPVRRYRGGWVSAPLPTDVAGQVAALARAERLTPFAVLAAAVEILLARLSGATDFAVGTVVAGRDRPQLEATVGFLARTVALRSDLAGPGQSFLDLARRIGERMLRATDQSSLPFERLVDELGLPRDPSRSPLFSVLCVLQNTPRTTIDLPGLRLRPLEPDTRAAQFDLSWYIGETAAGYDVGAEYDSDLLAPATVRRWTGHLMTILAAAVAAPDTPIGRLPVLSAAQWRSQLVDWNATATPLPAVTVADLVTETIRARGGDIAVRGTADTTPMTYADLDQLAGQVATWLTRHGVVPGDRVAVGLARGPALVAALLGVWRAGAAYVPLDADYPAARLEQMVADAGLTAAVTDAATRPRLPLGALPALEIDDPGLRALPGTAAGTVPTHPGQAAYVIFTSGSTGRPKGVVVPHRALVNLVASAARRTAIGPGSTLLAVTSLSFDIAGLELWTPLSAGGCVVVCDAATANAGDALRATVEHVTPSHLQATPATWRMLLDAGWAGSGGLIALCGGEALPRDLAARLRPRVGQLWNMYGPTETTIWSGAVRVATDDVTIGGPLANTAFYVLDPSGRPVPPGVAGELHIGGAGLADGYLGQPGRTAERFVPDPYAVAPGARMYRTGDEVRQRPDGLIDFVARLDDQVKVRGYRIELGDIEAALADCPGVAEAVVTVQGGPGEESLLGHVRAGDGPEPTVGALREHLTQRIPGYMIPARFAIVDAFPLTPNGKVDRRALAARAHAPMASGAAYVPPQGPVETELAAVWADLLGLERVGREDNFFTIGGDSLIAVRMAAVAGQRGISVTTKQVFLHQSLRELAAAAGTVRLVATQGEVTGELALPIATHQFHDGINPAADYHVIAFQFEAREPLDPDVLDAVLGELVAHHDSLRTRFVPGAPGERGRLVIDPHTPGRLLEVCEIGAVDDAAAAAALAEWTARVETGFVRENGGLFRAVLLDFAGSRPQRLLLAGHYLVADVVSWHILIADLDVLYRRRVRGEPYDLPAKTTSMLEWVGRLVEHAAADEVAAELPVWSDPVRGQAVPIPVDRPGGDNRVAANDAAFLLLTVEETAELLDRVVKAARISLDAALLAAIGHALLPGRDLFPVDIYVPGRDSPYPDMDLSRTVGWLTYRYPMWLTRSSGAGPVESARGIARQLAAVPRGGLGHGQLRYYRRGGSGDLLAGFPVPDVLFNFFGAAPGGFQVLKPVAGTSGHYHDVESVRMRPLMINGAVFRGQLRMEWEFSSGTHDRETVEAWIAAARTYLLDLTEACPPSAGDA